MSARDMVLAALGEHDQGAEEVLGVDDAEDAVTIALFYDADALGLDVLGETLGVIRFETMPKTPAPRDAMALAMGPSSVVCWANSTRRRLHRASP